MAHEITETDGAVFHKTKAWHGLGYVVDQAMSPSEALQLAGLDWRVYKDSGIASLDERSVSTEFQPVIREDTGDILSVQSENYKVVQNAEVFDLAYSLGSDVKVESALSLQGGKKIICLLQGNTFAPSNSQSDGIQQYFALLSSHDGTIALSGLPTSVRIVCKNTLKMALEGGKNAIRFTHTGNIEAKKESMRVALRRYAEIGTLFQQKVEHMSNTILTSAQIQQFFLDVYQTIEEPVVMNPKGDKEYAAYLRSVHTINRWCAHFDIERSDLKAPPSVWMAVNAVTKDIQHYQSNKGRKTEWDNKAYSNLLGAKQDATVVVAKMGLQLV